MELLPREDRRPWRQNEKRGGLAFRVQALVRWFFCRLGLGGHYFVMVCGGPVRCPKCGRTQSRWERRRRVWVYSPKEDRRMHREAKAQRAAFEAMMRRRGWGN